MLPGPLTEPHSLQDPPAQTVRQMQFDGGLRVTFESADYDAALGHWIFGGTVTATYDVTVVKCEKLTIDSRQHKGWSEGNVSLVDPEGTIQANRLAFDWVERSGSAESVVIQAGEVHIEAARIRVEPELWVLHDATGELSRNGGGTLKFQAESVSVNPGRNGVARRVYLRAFGSKIGPIARIPFNLRRRLKPIGVPSVTNKKGKGIGVSWGGAVPLGEFAAAEFNFGAFPKTSTSYGLQVAYSPLDPDSDSLIVPRSDLREHADDSWFGNISVESTEDEHDRLREKRSSFAAGTLWNVATSGRRPDTENLSKSYDVSYETGGSMAGFGAIATVRMQSVRPDATTAFVQRALVDLTVGSPPIQIAKGLDVRLRADVFGTIGGNHYGWFRGEAGLVARPINGVTVGIAYVGGSQTGTPDFELDRLPSFSAVHFRADYARGPYTVRVLAKYDTATKVWYDREYEIALQARAFEPFILVREFPSDFRFGLRFRMDNLTDRLRRREQTRTKRP